MTVSKFLMNVDSLLAAHTGDDLLSELDVLNSMEFSDIQSDLHEVWSGLFNIYTNSSLRDIGTAGIAGGATVYFLSVNLSVGAVALALECVLSSCAVVLYLDSQTAIDAYISKMSLAVPDFYVPCWIKRHHIFNLIRDKDLAIRWVKVKDHSGVAGNVVANAAANCAICSKFFLPIGVCKCFLVAEAMAMSGNACHFVRNVFQSICCAH
ncbi:hypothetical protein G9A89_008993 [Geosiphon pyriformis]|nr:hypothetical protein G9A89_008993 [Geosiphon pyriformis]